MSNEYKHVLVAVDLTKDSHLVLERALPIAKRNGAKISIIHTLEPLGFAYGGDIPMDLTSIQDQLSTMGEWDDILESVPLSAYPKVHSYYYVLYILTILIHNLRQYY